MTRAKAGMGKGKARPDSGAKSRPRVAAKQVEATPDVMNVQGLALEEIAPYDWSLAQALRAFIDVPLAKSCRCQGVFPVSKEKCCGG